MKIFHLAANAGRLLALPIALIMCFFGGLVGAIVGAAYSGYLSGYKDTP